MSQIRSYTEALLASYQKLGGINHLEQGQLPSRESIARVLRSLRDLLFPGFFQDMTIDVDDLPYRVEGHLMELHQMLCAELGKSFTNFCDKLDLTESDCREKAETCSYQLLEELPKIRAILTTDLEANFLGDPAAECKDQVLLSYPGIQAISVYRLAHFLHSLGVPLIPRMMTEIAHSETGIDIHPGAKIGTHFCIDHGTGIVIGATSVLGNHVKLYQGVTIGALSLKNVAPNEKRHPTLEDGVVIYARTTVLGGKTVVGKDSVIGGNVWLTHSVPPNSQLYLSSDRKQVLKKRETSS